MKILQTFYARLYAYTALTEYLGPSRREYKRSGRVTSTARTTIRKERLRKRIPVELADYIDAIITGNELGVIAYWQRHTKP